jgi:SH3 domain-containing YSC84-like protein 1
MNFFMRSIMVSQPTTRLVILLCLWLSATNTQLALGQTREAQIVDSATVVLQEIMAVPANRIPQSLLAGAQGVAIIPGVVKGGLVIGIRHGNGVMVVRADTGNWQAPMFLTLTGGSVGWQAGVQATDVILVFKTKKSVQGMMSGKFTLGADASAAIGPVGREAAAATDLQLKAEIYSYSRNRGLFAGASLGGTSLTIDTLAAQRYYAAAGTAAGGPTAIPPSAARLIEQLTLVSGATQVAPVQTSNPLASNPVSPQEAGPSLTGANAHIGAQQQQLANASLRLYTLLDKNWKNYLALPSSIYTPARVAKYDKPAPALQRYNRIVTDQQYTTLTARQEFIETHRLLQQATRQQETAQSASLPLPPPPVQ